MSTPTHEDLIEQLDSSVFRVRSQTSSEDKTSLLRIHRLMRSRKVSYTYLEIGSYMGGTLLPHVNDARCRRVISIDKRPDAQPDERGQMFEYVHMNTNIMFDAIRPFVSLAELQKVTAIDADASQVSPYTIGDAIDLALIDGEHTNVAAYSDFFSVLPNLASDALVAFHDTNLVSDAIKNIQVYLSYSGIAHRLFCLPACVSVIALRGSIGAASEAFAPYALGEAAYIRSSKQNLREEIARAVSAGLHLQMP